MTVEPGFVTPRADALLRARAEATELIADLGVELLAIAESTEANPDDEHDAEGSTVGFERARVGSLLERARRSAARIEEAIARLDAGDYGRCVTCGAVIPDERLDALPHATSCFACAAAARGR